MCASLRQKCFNGAAGVNPRMAGVPITTSSSPTASFNGAAGVNPRMEVIIITEKHRNIGFNGAAGVNPRMVPIRSHRELT